jgi:hypothetical protein
LSSRASDSERDEAIRILNDALATGRLNLDDHGERVEAALKAVTIEELDGLTADVQAPPQVPSETRRRWRRYALLSVAVAAIIALVVVIQMGPSHTAVHTTSNKSSRISIGAQSPGTSSATCTSSSGVLSCQGPPEGARVATPRFTVSSNATIHYTESSNCDSGAMLLDVFQVGVPSVPELSLFGCNSLTHRLTKGTYYVTISVTGDWKLSVTPG